MNDENDEHEGHAAFFFPFMAPDPEAVERMKMEQSQSAHETREFFDGLTADQLRKLSGLFRTCATSDGEAAAYYMGIISGFLDQKFKLCLGCGQNHEEALAEMTGAVVDPEPAREPDSEQQYLIPQKGTIAYEKMMSTYGLEQDDDGSDRVMCKNCGKWYESLNDRARRSPGKSGCSGCINKEKWG